MKTWRLILLASMALIGAATPSLALEPAGGPPFPASDDEDAPLLGPNAPDASISERTWLADNGSSDVQALAPASGSGSGFTLGALILLLGLGGGAIALRLKNRKSAPLSRHESRLDVLSSSRIGPKAYAVTAHVGGRVMLLGVTDHNVTLLTWLDGDDAPEAAESAAPAPESETEDAVPDDYPGSALRASSAPGAAAFASTQSLKRFQEVLRGVVRSDDSGARAPLSSITAPASALAAQTSDVVAPRLNRATATDSAPAAAKTPRTAPTQASPVSVSSAPVSLRRKRQRRAETSSTAQKSTRADAATDSPSFEGQVAGLKRLTRS